MKAEFLWEVFAETGAPEVYLLYKRQTGSTCDVQKETVYVSDDAGARPSDNRI